MVVTNILFEGMTKLGVCASIMDAWVARRFTPCVSTALAYEYEEVLTNKLRPDRSARALLALQALLSRAEFVPIYYLTRPLSRDPDDDFVIECAFNAGADIVTRNARDLAVAEKSLNIAVLTPEQFLRSLE